MIRRSVLAAALLSAAILPFVGMAPVAAAKKPKVKFSNARLSAKTVKAGATVRADVTAIGQNGATVSSVSLRLVRSGAGAQSTGMSSLGNGAWMKNFTAPSNTGPKKVSVSVYADAQTSIGPKSYKIGTIKVEPTPIDSNSPPPPPPI